VIDRIRELAQIAGGYVLLGILTVLRAVAWLIFRVLDYVLWGLAATCLALAIVWFIAGCVGP